VPQPAASLARPFVLILYILYATGSRCLLPMPGRVFTRVARYSLGRLTIGATDFSTSVYRLRAAPLFCLSNPHEYPTPFSYNDSPKDFNQSHFSIKHDEDKIIPLALRAQQATTPYFHIKQAQASSIVKLLCRQHLPMAGMACRCCFSFFLPPLAPISVHIVVL
jgi:hypothetical protein